MWDGQILYCLENMTDDGYFKFVSVLENQFRDSFDNKKEAKSLKSICHNIRR